LTVAQILAWADAYHQQTGSWPNLLSGRIERSHGESWRAVNDALRDGRGGLRGDSSLARLLAEQRGVPNHAWLPPLTIEQILMWADAHHERTSRWPNEASGLVEEEPSLTWKAVNQAMKGGCRGLPRGLSLAELLVARRGHRCRCALPPLRVEHILAWADAHWDRTGRWPNVKSGFVEGEPFETWCGINCALASGYRGLPGGSSLAKLFVAHHGVRSQCALPKLDVASILAWADVHHRRTGRWPIATSGNVERSSGETWNGIDLALRHAGRGLPGGSSLARLLAEHRGVPNKAERPALSLERVLNWADAHGARTGAWPNQRSGPVEEDRSLTWVAVDSALVKGWRGLPGGLSLAKLLVERRGVRSRCALPPLTIEQILAWADDHYERTGQWPKTLSGAVHVAPGETWRAIDRALHAGKRGLSGRSSLYRLLTKRGRLP
jgi:hypothetical protein